MTQPIDHGDSGDFGDTYKQRPQPVTFALLKGRWRSAMHSQSEMRHKRQCAEDLESLEQRVRELRDEMKQDWPSVPKTRKHEDWCQWALTISEIEGRFIAELNGLLGGQ